MIDIGFSLDFSDKGDIVMDESFDFIIFEV